MAIPPSPRGIKNRTESKTIQGPLPLLGNNDGSDRAGPKFGEDLLATLGTPFFQMMVDNVPDLIWAKDMEDRYLFVNKAICSSVLMCDTAAEAVGKKDSYFAAIETEKGFLHTFGQICMNSDQAVRENRAAGRFIEDGLVRGQYLAFDVHKAPFFDDSGQMVGTVGCARDITKEQAVEKKLKESEERFRQMADFLPLPIGEFDFDFTLFYANRAGLEYFGYTQEDYEGHPSVAHLIPGNKESQVRSWLESLRQGAEPRPFEMEFLRKNGSRIYGVINAVPIEKKGKIVAIRACFTDLTHRRMAEIALQENETRFRTLFNGLNDAVFVHPFAEKGFENFVEVNDVACKWYGYTREELLGLSCQDLILDPIGQGLGSVDSRQDLARLGRRTLETLNKRKNREIFPVEISSCIFYFHGEKMILSAVRDITDRRHSEKQRKDAVKFAAEQEKYALVGQVAGKMAHDFNNILGGIMGNAELSLMDCNEPETRKTLDIILTQTLRGRNLTKNLVAFARDQEPKESFFNINEKLDLVLSLMKKDLDGIQLIRQFSPDLPELLADPGMIEHALVNLIQNSIHAMSLTLEPKLEIRTGVSEKVLIIEIQDNGCGIPDKFHDDIYSPCFTLKGSRDINHVYDAGIKGTGYGMSNVKKYILKHRGRISFTSAQGKGTCFTLSVPLMQRELTRREKKRMTRKLVMKNKKILLVEDETAIAGVQKKILSHPPFDHQVVVAVTGQEAIEAFDRGDFDLVSLDYILPGRLNGLDVYSHIRRKNTHIPVVFLSGNIDFLESMKDLKAEDSLMDHLSKPCENIVFVDTINAWLARVEPVDSLNSLDQ